ncbi:unnamed protein product [Parascedosporium putredinis]|uniref:Uncharacterized protein n=1 Tax=Parascedosporium putredinis TaxID=1442378 RepID=A0A9P1HEE9_9PEZI|nr:unnamed protein product [Parascedosporium putredinis]CAI8004942.1 unnamed protein product [Parascedosporium putredinis]
MLNYVSRPARRLALVFGFAEFDLGCAVTGLEFTYMPGVRGTEVLEKVLPPSPRKKNVNWTGKTGSWRAHMNVLQRPRLRPRHPRLPPTLAQRPSRTLAGQYPALAKTLQDDDYSLDLSSAPATLEPGAEASPYGEGWDVLWLGHVGSHLPADWLSRKTNANGEGEGAPPPLSLLTLLARGDETVADKRHLKRHPFADRIDDFAERYEDAHTRVVHEARGTSGIQAYATFTSSYDLLLRDWCDGVYAGSATAGGKGAEGANGFGSADGEERPVCVTTQPPLMSQYYSKGEAISTASVGVF